MNSFFRYSAKHYAYACFSLLLLNQSCTHKTPEQTATDWTNDIKQKAMKYADQQPDKTVVDSVHHEIVTYKNGKLLKHYYFTERVDQNDNKIGQLDTGMIIYYSTNPDFQFIRQPCRQGAEESYEIVTYKGNRYGLAKYINCRQKGKQIGFQFKNLNVGTWITYDSTGAITKQVDAGNSEKLRDLDSLSIGN